MKTSTPIAPKQLEHFRMLRSQSQVIVKEWKPSLETLQAALACTWEIFFDVIQSREECALNDLNTLSGILQKLSACHQHIAAIEEEASARSVDPEAPEAPQQLPLETLQSLEQQLLLL